MRNHLKKDRLFELAERRRLPVVLFAEGGGGRPGDVDMPIVAGLDCRAFHLFARLSGLVPLVGIASGYCFAGNAALLGCCDVVIATEDASIGMGGPAMIEGGGLGVFKRVRGRPDRRPVRQRRRRPARRRRRRGGRGGQALPGLLRTRARACGRRRPRAGPDAAARPDPGQPQARLRRPRGDRRPVRRDARAAPRLRPRDGDRAGPDRRASARHGRQRPLPSRRGDRRRRRRQGGPLHGAVRRLRPAAAVPVRHARVHGRPRGRAHGHRAPLLAACSSPAPTSTCPPARSCCARATGSAPRRWPPAGFKAPLFTIGWPTSEFGAMGLEGAVKLGMRRELEAIEDPAERERVYEAAVAAAYERGRGVSMAAYFEIDDVIDPADTRRWISTLFDDPARGLVGAPRQAPARTSTPGSARQRQQQRPQAPRSSTSWLSTRTPEPVRQPVDRPLEPRIVERDQRAALVADQVVMVVAAGLSARTAPGPPPPPRARPARARPADPARGRWSLAPSACRRRPQRCPRSRSRSARTTARPARSMIRSRAPPRLSPAHGQRRRSA